MTSTSNGTADFGHDVNVAINDSIVQPTILRLPRELRDLIYEYYTQVQGGYTYNFMTNKLKQADGRPISHSLVFACRQTASELRDIFFRLNTITFSTYFSESTRIEAGFLNTLCRVINFKKKKLVQYLAPRLLTPTMVQAAMDEYPQFSQILVDWISQGLVDYNVHDFSDGEATSRWDEFTQYLLQSMSKHPRFLKEAKKAPNAWRSSKDCNVVELKDVHFEPWLIPCNADMSRLAKICELEPGRPHIPSAIKYSYSAASVALRFLHSLSKATRNTIRKIMLLEDREAVANPNCHGQGLIKMCKAHPKLRIEHIVKLWQNAFPIGYARPDYKLACTYGRGLDGLERDRLESVDVTKAIGSWIAEALALPSYGMPRESYSLTFDGNPNPEHASEVFQIVRRDAAWQSALDSAYMGGTLPKPSPLARRLQRGYMYECLPEAIYNISIGNGPITCNFDLGSPYDIENLLQEHRGWSIDDWSEKWNSHQPKNFQTKPPLPPWHILRWQYVL